MDIATRNDCKDLGLPESNSDKVIVEGTTNDGVVADEVIEKEKPSE